MARRKKRADENPDEAPVDSFKPKIDLQAVLSYKSHEDPVIASMAEFIESIYSRPELRIYAGLIRVADKLGEELEEFSEKRILSGDKDDKIFERVISMYKQQDEFKKGLDPGRRALIDAGLAVSEKQEVKKNFLAQAAQDYEKKNEVTTPSGNNKPF